MKTKHPILLLHGALGSKKQFSALHPLLEAEFEIFEIDFDGHGSGKDAQQFSIDLWSTFYHDYKKGRKSIPISSWRIEDYAKSNINELRLKLNKPETEKQLVMNLKSVTKFGAFASIIAGIFGMLFCLPFLFSSNLADLVGAGFPFVGGAILTVGGLLTLSNLSRPEKSQLVTAV